MAVRFGAVCFCRSDLGLHRFFVEHVFDFVFLVFVFLFVVESWLFAMFPVSFFLNNVWLCISIIT